MIYTHTCLLIFWSPKIFADLALLNIHSHYTFFKSLINSITTIFYINCFMAYTFNKDTGILGFVDNPCF